MTEGAHNCAPSFYINYELKRTAKGGPYMIITHYKAPASESRVTATYGVSEFTSDS